LSQLHPTLTLGKRKGKYAAMRTLTRTLAVALTTAAFTFGIGGFANATDVTPIQIERTVTVGFAEQTSQVTSLILDKEDSDSRSVKKLASAPVWHNYGRSYQWICYMQYDVDSMSKCKGGTLVIWDKAISKEVSRIYIPLPSAVPANVNWYCVASGASFVLSIPGQPASVGGWILKGAVALLGVIGIKGSC
jgi:hypothetical protein